MAKEGQDCNGFNKGRLTERVRGNSEAIQELKEGQLRMWEALDKIKNRLPNWAVVLFGVLLAILGYLAKGKG
ncbi:MAG: hypothetical protein ACYST6_13415 [Planctomycetota bacterium]|jgi:hypothetical protein